MLVWSAYVRCESGLDSKLSISLKWFWLEAIRKSNRFKLLTPYENSVCCFWLNWRLAPDYVLNIIMHVWPGFCPTPYTTIRFRFTSSSKLICTSQIHVLRIKYHVTPYSCRSVLFILYIGFSNTALNSTFWCFFFLLFDILITSAIWVFHNGTENNAQREQEIPTYSLS